MNYNYVNITDFGAKCTDAINTQAIQNAVLACRENGGGTVIVPPGTFYTGSIELYSNITLFLQSGAVLKSTAQKEDFPYIGFWHNEMRETTSLIWARNQENICIKGEGIIDLSSEITYKNIRHMSYSIADQESLDERRKAEGVLDKNENRVNQPLFFESCRNVKIAGIRIINSPCWTVTFSRSESITVDSIEVDNHLNIQNNDGVHLSACRNAVISNCRFSCADDCIAMTCITAHEGVNENITVMNCIMRSRSAAVRIGHNTRGVTITNLNVYDTNRGIAIFTGKENRISDVVISNLRIETKLSAGAWWGKAEPIIICAAAESRIENVSVNTVNGICENGIVICGNDHNINEVHLSHIHVQVKKTDDFHVFCDGLDMRPYDYIKTAKGPFLLYTDGIDGITLTDVQLTYEKSDEF